MSSPTIEKGNDSTEFCKVDDECAHMQTVCYPCSCTELPNVCKYIHGEGHCGVENIREIPTGSMYFAATRGPIAELNARVTGSPYDLVGIVFQSGGSTYVFMVRNERVESVLLTTLMSDDSIIRHATLPLKDFDDCPCDDTSPPQMCPTADIGLVHASPGQGAEAANGYADNFTAGVTQGEGANYEIKGTDDATDAEKSGDCCAPLSYGCPTTCVPDGFYDPEDVCDYKDWVAKLRKFRACRLANLFKKYSGMGAEADGYQRMAAMFGLPVSEEFRSKEQFTGPELVSLILFQAGLIWDNRFAINGGNPYCSCNNPCVYKSLAEQAACASPTESFLILTTPANYDSCCQMDTSCCQQSCAPTCNTSCDPCCVTSCAPSKVDQSLSEFDLRAQQFGFQSTKGSEEKGEYFDNTSEDKSCGNVCYPQQCPPQNCYPPVCPPCPPCPKPVFPKPTVKEVHSKTILFGSVRVVDLLLGQYRAQGIDIDGNDLGCIEATATGCGIDGELKSALSSLASQRKAGDKLDYDLNPDLNTTAWFGDRLVTIELCNNPRADNSCLVKKELHQLSHTVEELLASFTQERMISQDSFMSGALQQKLSGMYGAACAELNDIACACPTSVNYNNCCVPCCEPVPCATDYCCYRIPLSGCCQQTYVSCVPQPYFYGCDWSYQCGCGPYDCNAPGYADLCCRLERLIVALKGLKYRTPVNSILLSLIVHSLKQAECLYTWLCSCRVPQVYCAPQQYCQPTNCCDPCVPVQQCCPPVACTPHPTTYIREAAPAAEGDAGYGPSEKGNEVEVTVEELEITE